MSMTTMIKALRSIRALGVALLVVAGVALHADPPEATITSPTGAVTVMRNQAVNFTATSSNAVGWYDYIVNSVSWSFGDGTTGGGASTSHAYATAGTYTATLTVNYTAVTCTSTNADGECVKTSRQNRTDKATRIITVSSATVSPVSPANPAVNAGSSLQFSASVSGALNTGVSWSVSGGGSINGSGLFTATTAGAHTVTAASVDDPSKKSTTSVTVNSIVTGVNISPASVSLRAGEGASFTATAVGLGGNNSAVTWSTNGGSITSGGAYTAPIQGGTFTVTATSVQNTSKSASGTVTVASASVSVPTPSNSSVNAGSSLQFSASVSGSVNPSVTWSVSGGGTIDGGGLFSATTAGTHTVTATSILNPSKSNSTTVTVNSIVTGMNLSPTSISLRQGEGAAFTASAAGLGGNNTAVTWSTNGGTITSGGVYTAPLQAGTFSVTATSVQDSNKTATATVSVATIVVGTPSPAYASVNTGSTIQFSSSVTGAMNQGVSWSVTGGGTINGSGLFTATTSGTYTVMATSVVDGSKSNSTQVTVNGLGVSLAGATTVPYGGSTTLTPSFVAGSGVLTPGNRSVASGSGIVVGPLYATTAYTLTVTNGGYSTTAGATVQVQTVGVSVPTPTNPSVPAGSSQAFSATVSGAGGATGITWSVNGGGSISTTGLFTAGNVPGTWTVTATSVADGTKFERTNVTVRAVVSGVAVSANGPLSFRPGENRTFTAVVNGVGIVNSSVTWSVLDANGGTITAAGYYTAPNASGNYRVQALSNQDGSTAGQATIRVQGWALHWKRDVIYVGTKEIGEVDGQGLHVTLVDHLGSPRFLVGPTGALESEQKFLPFGESLADPNAASKFAKGFTNHEQTDPSGLIYMQARFYAPWYGRFLSPDPGLDQHFEHTQSWNIYSYVQNNPTMQIDPTGMEIADELKRSPRRTCVGQERAASKPAEKTEEKSRLEKIGDKIWGFFFGASEKAAAERGKALNDLADGKDADLDAASGRKLAGALAQDASRAGEVALNVTVAAATLGVGSGTAAINASKPAAEVLPGSLKREFPSQHLAKSLNEIKDALRSASGADKLSLQKAKKLLEQSARLMEKVGGK